ncbi:hypothetical protein [Methylovulum psychrotolerans]|uniref:Uncharacterized protein n=1 Tax=Methylovulum psychrotolerans TaxID=1704499 RepID=A0A2S5CJF2_9GAMM|nr:hypothetical protein [Methylovulum psychrotolerans]POZ50934.1 hypothetical protein AADEFJLK_03406 [Methylovulum psychrotolerans]
MPKPFRKLTRADFTTSPIWEWLMDENTEDEESDESYVQATSYTQVPRLSFGQFIVSAAIELKNGDVFPGVAEVTVAGDEVNVQPVNVFMLDRLLTIPGMDTNRLLTRYTQTVENYPIAWTLNVLIEKENAKRSASILDADMKDMQAVMEMMNALLLLKKGRLS